MLEQAREQDRPIFDVVRHALERGRQALEPQVGVGRDDVEIEDDVLIIDPPEEPKRAEVDTYDDHRMAMSFALAGTKVHGVVIKDAECVNKTYPQFFDDLAKVLASRG